MYIEILEKFKKKKQKKEKIKIFSFINQQTIDIYNNFDIDILRFDIEEFSNLYNYKGLKTITAQDIIPLLKNLKAKDNNKYFAIDLPLSECYDGKDVSVQKAIDFFRDSKADFLVIDIRNDALDLIEKLSSIQIPVIVSSTRDCPEEKKYLQELHNKLIEAESKGAILFILNGFNSNFVQNLKSSTLIPVLSTSKDAKSDGIFIRFSSSFGLLQDDYSKYLNLYDLIKDGINDCINDIQ